MITVDAKKVGSRVIATVKVRILRPGNILIRSNLRIKEVRPRMRPRRSVSCVKLL